MEGQTVDVKTGREHNPDRLLAAAKQKKPRATQCVGRGRFAWHF